MASESARATQKEAGWEALAVGPWNIMVRHVSLVGNAGGLVGGGVVAGILDAVAVPGALQITCIARMHVGHEGVTAL